MEKKEIIALILSVVIMTLIIFFGSKTQTLPALIRYLLLAIGIIGFVILAKKIVAYNLDVRIINKTWEFQRYGIAEHSKFNQAIPVGLIVPLLLSLFSAGIIKFLAFLQFDSYALPTKAVKKYGIVRLSGILEWDDALIVFYSLMPLLALAIIAKFFSPIFFIEFAKYSWIYVFCNLLPISQLDGTKLFFGSRPLFILTWIITIVAWPIIF